MSLEQKKLSLRCFGCPWTGGSLYRHLRFDHQIAAVLAPYDQPLDWAIDVTPTKLVPQEEKSEGRRWNILIGCTSHDGSRTWFLLTAEQEWMGLGDGEQWSDFQFQLRRINRVDRSGPRSLTMMKYAGPGYQGLWTWLTPSYSDPAQCVLLPAQQTVPLIPEGPNGGKTLRIVVSIRPL
jgi:hypothetical protein